MRRLCLLVAVGLLIALSGVRPGAQTSTWRPVVLSDAGMVATGHALASEAGIRILKAGGNVEDAAIAAWAVQGLAEPERRPLMIERLQIGDSLTIGDLEIQALD